MRSLLAEGFGIQCLWLICCFDRCASLASMTIVVVAWAMEVFKGPTLDREVKMKYNMV